MNEEWLDSGAIFSPNQKYRYRLWRTWDETLPRCVFVMLNPSVADATTLDPTARKCIGFAKRWGCGEVELVNAFALVSTDPSVLRSRVPDPVGAQNDSYILKVTANAKHVVAAWSTWSHLHNRGRQLLHLLSGVKLECLGTTIDGYPKHPLYIAYETPLQPYPDPERKI